MEITKIKELYPIKNMKMSEEKQLTIDDLVVLGNAAPDEISDNRKTVCT